MHKELNSIKLIRDYMANNGIIDSEVNSIDTIYNFFKYLTLPENNLKFNSLYILNYIKQYIASNEVAKRKTSARVFEDLLAVIFQGEVTDNNKRKNFDIDVPDCFNFVKDKIAGNKREKIDIIFYNHYDSYGISLKTLMCDNTEINMGSFEKKVLFDGFKVSEYLSERKTEYDIGLGSKPRLKKLLEKIQENKKYEEFCKRFKDMFDFIFSDDIILAIKNDTKMELYFLKGSDFTEFVTKKTNQIDTLLTIINRWEGNSIRIDRTKLIEELCDQKVTLDLSILNNTVIALINKFDYTLHTSYVEYFNSTKSNIKDNITNEINDLFKEFDKNLKTLK